MNDPYFLTLNELGIGHSKIRQPLFQHITTHISQGTLIGLFGRNGIGKSTLLRTMAGLQQPVAGKVMIKNQDISKLSPYQIAKQIAFVPSHPLRMPRLSVADMVGTGRYGFTNWMGIERNSDKEAIHKALEATEITHLAHRDSATLSDGELQRASIARSLAQETPLILFDEPTAFLDVGNKYRTIYLLRELTQKEHKAIVFSTHDLTLALQVCDILWIIDDNGFYAQSPAELLEKGTLDKLFKPFGLVFDKKTLNYRLETTPPSSS